MAKLCRGGWILEWRWNVLGRGVAKGCEVEWLASGERVLGGSAGMGGGGGEPMVKRGLDGSPPPGPPPVPVPSGPP